MKTFLIIKGGNEHQLALIYKADFKNKSLYNKKEIKILDRNNDYAIWKDINILRKSCFYPKGIKKLLNKLD